MGPFDYIVLGGGSAGCAVAGRLSENPGTSVCLVEAGGEGQDILIRAPMGFAATAPYGINSWHYQTVPQRGLNGRRGFQPRGKALGGSSAINAMMYVRGHPAVFDRWAALGNPGWRYADVLPLFKRSENNETFTDPAFHGTGGPLNVMHLRSPSRMNQVFLDACRQSGIPLNPDYNGVRQDGCWNAQVTQKDGERCSAAHAFIHPNRSRRNLTVLTKAHVNRILFDGNRAIGAQYRQGGEVRHVLANREVVLSGGAFGSPQILMLSGIGPAEHLRRMGIGVLRDVAGVGQNLQDHITSVLTHRSPGNPDLLGISAAGGLKIARSIFEWRRQRTGIITSNAAESGAFVRSAPDTDMPDGDMPEGEMPEGEMPDIELEFVVGIVDDHNRKMHLGHGYSLHITLLQPKSVGEIKLASPDPRTMPLIDPRFLSHPDDIATLVAATQRALDILAAKPFDPYRGKMLYHYDRNDPAQIEAMMREQADTEYHPSGTCKMGPDSDPMAVVDARLRVKGVSGLRVCDASIMPFITNGNTNAPSIMIGEKCADLLRAEA